MGITADVVKVWNKGVKDNRFTAKDVDTIIGKGYKRKDIASIFCKFVKRGIASRGTERGIFVKIKDCEMPTRKSILLHPGNIKLPVVTKDTSFIEAFNASTQQDSTLDSLAIGKSILIYIDNLKNQIIEKQQRLNEEREIVKELIEKAKKMDILYKQAQSRIIELNAGKSKGLHLSELHEFREGLPR